MQNSPESSKSSEVISAVECVSWKDFEGRKRGRDSLSLRVAWGAGGGIVE